MTEEPRRQGFRPDDETWAKRLQSVVDFVAEHGHLPRQTQSLAAEERRLGYWLSNQRSDLKNRLLPAERAERLDTALPQWRSGDRTGRGTAGGQARRMDGHPPDAHHHGHATNGTSGAPGGYADGFRNLAGERTRLSEG